MYNNNSLIWPYILFSKSEFEADITSTNFADRQAHQFGPLIRRERECYGSVTRLEILLLCVPMETEIFGPCSKLIARDYYCQLHDCISHIIL